jgi:catechol 2,3-dioxygenase-like lactoylglutathione lyase family enzyme
MLDHVALRVSDFAASRAFYDTVLAPLGMTEPRVDEARPLAFWNGFGILADGKPVTSGAHVAFTASTNAEVDAFWQAGTGAGYEDNGAPGERPYHPGYYGAFLLDPDGNNIEAVCHNR